MIISITITFILLVGVAVWANFSRTIEKDIKDLVPNCLLTKHPVVFVTGYRSLFYFTSYWNQIPNYLREHGYDVEIMSLPWRGRKARLKALAEELVNLKSPIHLIGDSSIEGELISIAEMELENIATVTVVSDEEERPSKLEVSDLKPSPTSKIKRLILEDSHSTKLDPQKVFLKINNVFNGGRAQVSSQVVGLNNDVSHELMKPYLRHVITLAEEDL